MRKGVRVTALVASLLLGLALSLTIAPVVSPPGTKVDALFVPATKPGAQDEALRLARSGQARVLLVSDPRPGQTHRGRLCTDPPDDIVIQCFRPSPERTVGEIEAALALARGHHAESVGVVTFPAHMFRVRLLTRLRWAGTVETYTFELTQERWATVDDIVYAIGAYPTMVVEEASRALGG